MIFELLTFKNLHQFFIAFIMGISKNSWDHIENMNRARHSHACGVVNRDSILVAGGKDDLGSMLDSVETFSLKTMGWMDSTPLPNQLSSEASLQFGTTVLVFSQTRIYQFNETSFEWFVREENLLSERADYVAIPITGM